MFRPKTGQPRGRLWLWLIPIILLAAAFEFAVSPALTRLWTSIFPFFAEPPGYRLEALMDTPTRTPADDFAAWYGLIVHGLDGVFFLFIMLGLVLGKV